MYPYHQQQGGGGGYGGGQQQQPYSSQQQHGGGGYGGGGAPPPQQQGMWGGGGYPPPSSQYGGGGYPPPTATSGYPPATTQQGGWGGTHQQQTWGGASGGQQPQPPASVGPPPTAFQKGWYAKYYSQNSPQELHEMHRWFKTMDRDGSGSITGNELANVAVGGTVLGMDIALKLIRIFDADKNGTIDFWEYASLHKFLLHMQSLFSQNDRNRSGRLGAQEAHAALSAAGFQLSAEAIRSLHLKYNKTGYGVNMVEFLALVAHVAQAKSLFEWRDPRNTGYIQLNMDDLLDVTASF
ncbi:putative Far upstream element-binding protein 3 [Balamuthia mandrillaris]